jgi:predicted dienelactone hydrolase
MPVSYLAVNSLQWAVYSLQDISPNQLMKFNYLFILTLLISGCAVKGSKVSSFKIADTYLKGTYIKYDTLTLVDSSRHRIIPIATYNVVNSTPANARKKLVILNPGYGGKNTDYGYIARNLAINGYFVVVIQHDLSSDNPLPVTDDIYKLRKPFWDTGVKSIFFVTDKLKKQYPQLDYDHIILIGHSNGGDMAMLIANEYPQFAKIVISLDNRRVPFPRSDRPQIFSIRSSDQSADAGVLPSAEEQKKYKIRIVKMNTVHNDMGGMGTEAQKTEINTFIMNYLNSLQ